MGKRFFAIYLGTISVFSIIAGYALNFVYTRSGPQMSHVHMHEHTARGFSWSLFFSVVFLVMLAMSLYRKYASRLVKRALRAVSKARMRAVSPVRPAIIRIAGMTCNHCANNVTESIRKVAGVTDVQVDLVGKSAAVLGDFDYGSVKRAVEGAGYRVVDETGNRGP